MIDGGVMSYECILLQGHADRLTEDPEPHYATEVQRSRGQWMAWRERQDLRDRHLEQAVAGVVSSLTPHQGCPGNGVWRVNRSRGVVTCTGCPAVGSLTGTAAPDNTRLTDTTNPSATKHDRIAAEFTRARVPRDEDGERVRHHAGQADAGHVPVVVQGRPHPVQDPSVPLAHFAIDRGGQIRPTELAAELPQAIRDRVAGSTLPDPTIPPAQMPGVHRDGSVEMIGEPPASRRLDPDQPAPEDLMESFVQEAEEEAATVEPLRQREGDQRLPEPNGWPGAHSVAIRFMQARQDLGLRRYGSALQPFSGRDGLKDLIDELADGLVYAIRLMEAQRASLGQLVYVAQKKLQRYPGITNPGEIAQAVVDALIETFPLDLLEQDDRYERVDLGPEDLPGGYVEIMGERVERVVGYRRRR